MKTTKPAVILLALVLLTATAAQPAKKPAKKEISDTRTASCLVKVTTDPAVLPLNEFAVDYLLRSSGVAVKAARDVLDISLDLVSPLFTIEDLTHYSSGGRGMGRYTDRPTVPARTPTRTAARTSTRPAAAPTPRPRSTSPPTTTRRPTTRRAPTVTDLLPSAAEQTILFHLHVDLSEELDGKPIKLAAEEFMIALIENLRSALRGAFDQYRGKFDNQYELAFNEVIRAEAELVHMQIDLSNISDSRDLSRHVILSDIRNLRQILQSVIMQRSSNEALIEATTKRIAKEQHRRNQLVENDPIAKELLSILDVHERRLKDTQTLYESGKASVADMEDIREKIIRARIELAQRQEEASNPPGSIVLSSLNDEVADLSIKVAMAQQEIRSLEEQLNVAEALLAKADRYELLSLKADIAKQNLEEALLWHARLGRNTRSIQPPDVTVIGAE